MRFSVNTRRAERRTAGALPLPRRGKAPLFCGEGSGVDLTEAIYTRQSVDRVDSISVESQAEFCGREAAGENIQIYTDRGYSGKNTDRPAFQRMMADVEAGKIRRVIVYRLDRISRSVLDFANVIDVFQRHGVDFVSTMEKFDTGTPIGKAMLMIVMIFAQLERETIQRRVVDAYSSRSRRGFYMGGRVPYGFRLKEASIDGIRTKMYEPVADEADTVRRVFALYAEPQTSLGDVARDLNGRRMKNRGGEPFSRNRIRDMVVNPSYVRADRRFYEFCEGQGAVMVNRPEDFIGTNGAYLYSGGGGRRKTLSMQGHILVLAPHEGLVAADVWLKCRRKCLNNAGAAKPVKAKATWLAGKLKCAQCGYALSAKVYHCKTKADNRYYLCSNKCNGGNCQFGSLDADIVDGIVLEEIKRKLGEFGALSRKKRESAGPAAVKQREKAEELDREIASLLEKIPLANETVMGYINARVAALDAQKRELYGKTAQLTEVCGDSRGVVTGYLDSWEELSTGDKLTVVDSLIENIYASRERLKICWRI